MRSATTSSRHRTGDASTISRSSGSRDARRAHGNLADPHDVRDHRDPELGEQRLAEHAQRDPHRGLARARPLEHVADVVEPVLLRPREVRVAGPGAREALRRVRDAFDRHQVPVLLFPLRVLDRDPDRAAQREAVTDAGDDLEPVAFELLPTAPPVAVPPPRELGRDLLGRDRDPGRKTLEHADERLPVGFTGREQAQHGVHHRRRPPRRRRSGLDALCTSDGWRAAPSPRPPSRTGGRSPVCGAGASGMRSPTRGFGSPLTRVSRNPYFSQSSKL